MHFYTCAVVLLVVGGTYAALPLPKYTKPCYRNDPGFEECAIESAQGIIANIIKGDRKYNIPPIDPLDVTEIRVDNSGPKQAGIAITLKNCKFYGPSGAQTKKVKVDFDKQTMNLNFRIPRVMILGQYEIKGRVLLLPITGKGPINVTIENIDIDFVTRWIVEQRDGLEFARLQDSSIPRTEVSRAYFKLENLFNGDKILGPEMNRVLNDNWRESFKELSPPVIEGLSQIIATIVNNIAAVVPYDVIFPTKV